MTISKPPFSLWDFSQSMKRSGRDRKPPAMRVGSKKLYKKITRPDRMAVVQATKNYQKKGDF